MENNTVCPKCGYLKETNSRYCPNCGAETNMIKQNNFSYDLLSREKLELDWSVIIIAISGLVCGVVAVFAFWWLAFVGLSIEIKNTIDIKKKNKKGKIIAYLGISLCGGEIVWYVLSRFVL